VKLAGGKGANLGEMLRAGLPVPPGFVVTTRAYDEFMKANGLRALEERLSSVDTGDSASLKKAALSAARAIKRAPVPAEVRGEIEAAYLRLCAGIGAKNAPVAVRSSATVEDTREASFAGQQSTLLNVRAARTVVDAVRMCWASTFTPRAIFYRRQKGFGPGSSSTAVVVQRQVMSEKAGVGFTVHPTTGEEGKVVVEGSYGQGEEVVSGRVTPDTFVMEKETGRVIESRVSVKRRMKLARVGGAGLKSVTVPAELRDRACLNKEELAELHSLAVALEGYFGYPQDFEWAIERGKVYLVQTRPVTITGRERNGAITPTATPLLRGLGASPGVGWGGVKLVLDARGLDRVKKGDILVTRMTTPDFVPTMVKAAGIVTDEGGMTSHAAIVSRELGIPCVVGTGAATSTLKEGVTVSVDGSSGLVFEGMVGVKDGSAEREAEKEEARGLKTRTKVYMNLGVPDKIDEYASIPFDGIGLMRIEFIIASFVREHPLLLVDSGRESSFVEKLAEGIAKVARAIEPRPVVVRFSDFKSNEYRELEGGERYEEVESNPMIGWRGVSRYIAPEYERAFSLEVKAVLKVREEMGLKNVWVMLPFVRTTWEVERCLQKMEAGGLKRGGDFKVWLMAEVPSIVFMAREFAELCDGFSIGSNDLTQLVLGIDRDSTRLSKLGYFDERNEAVKRAVAMLIEGAHSMGKTVSICGQAPSVYPELTEYLVKLGIDSVSVNPDSVARTRKLVSEVEQRVLGATEIAAATT